jgi:hypothetical protein
LSIAWLLVPIVARIAFIHKPEAFLEGLHGSHCHPQGLPRILQIRLQLQHLHPRYRLLAPQFLHSLL